MLSDGDLIIYEYYDDTSDYSSQWNWIIECDIYNKNGNGYYHNQLNSNHYRKLYIIPKKELEKYKIGG